MALTNQKRRINKIDQLEVHINDIDQSEASYLRH